MPHPEFGVVEPFVVHHSRFSSHTPAFPLAIKKESTMRDIYAKTTNLAKANPNRHFHQKRGWIVPREWFTRNFR